MRPAGPVAALRCSLVRGVSVGLIGSVLITLVEVLGQGRALGASPAADYSTGWAIFGLFVIVALLNPILRFLSPRAALTGRELVLAYTVLIVTTVVVSGGFVLGHVPQLAGHSYFATAENRWEQLLHPHVPDWMAVKDAQAAAWFYEGLPPGRAIPWGVWVTPLLRWYALMLVVWLVMICLVVMLRRPWVEGERLIFPLTVLPLELAAETRAAVPPFLRNWGMWIAFGLVVVVNSVKALHVYYPQIPDLTTFTLISDQAGHFAVCIGLFFDVVGLSFLLTQDVSLGLWLFTLIYTGLQGVANTLGFRIGEPDYIHTWGMEVGTLAVGAMLALTLMLLWRARQRLWEILSTGLVGQRGDEILSHRVLAWAVVGGIALITWWLASAGVPAALALLFLVLALFFLLGLTRIVAQAGPAYLQEPALPQALVVTMAGSRALGPHGLVPLAFQLSWTGEMRTMVMAAAANALKLGHEKRIRGRDYLAAVFAGILPALLLGGVLAVFMGYRYGGLELGHAYRHRPHWYMSWAVRLINSPREVEWAKMVGWAVGAGLFFAVSQLHANFAWWPINPVGMPVAITYTIWNAWFSIFLAWLLKQAVLRYGGHRIYQAAVPFFLGLVLGQFFSHGVWQIISIFTRTALPRLTV